MPCNSHQNIKEDLFYFTWPVRSTICPKKFSEQYDEIVISLTQCNEAATFVLLLAFLWLLWRVSHIVNLINRLTKLSNFRNTVANLPWPYQNFKMKHSCIRIQSERIKFSENQLSFFSFSLKWTLRWIHSQGW